MPTQEEAREWLDRYPIDERLTARQAEIVRLIAAGLTVEEVAAELGIAPSTALTHLARARGALRRRRPRRVRRA